MADRHKDKALNEFISETEEILENLYKNLEEMEKFLKRGRVDPDIVNEMFRGVHSIKGLSGMLGLEHLRNFSHTLENMLDSLRMSKLSLNSEVIETLGEGFETIKNILSRLQNGEDDAYPKIEEVISRINSVMKTYKVEREGDELSLIEIDEKIINVLTEYEEHRLRDNIRRGANLFLVDAEFPLDDFDEKLNQLSQSLKKVGEVITTLPSVDSPEEGKIKFSLLVGSERGINDVKGVIPFEGVRVKEIPRRDKEGGRTLEIAEEERREKTPVSVKSVTPTVRVDIYQLDEIMNIVGELMLLKSMFLNLSSNMKKEMGYTGYTVEIDRLCRMLERRLNELQFSIMGIRMVPVRIVFERLVRAVRKLSKELGKDVDVEIEGGETELDKVIVEELADPLLHIVRNAIDHGIEDKEERALLGKPLQGKIILRAYQKGNHVVIEVEDDGRGIDPERIRQRAIEMGWLSPSDVLSDEELYKFIFEPGFSTKKDVTDVSGRGVGLDVVRMNISKLSGMIDVESTPGEGTRFVIVLPITLAIIQALVVEDENKLYAIPLNSIQECLKINRKDIKTVEKREVMELRGSTLPLIRIPFIFGKECRDAFEEYFVVILGIGDKRVGLLARKLIGQQDVVVKPLGPLLKDVKGIAGATEMGDGRIALVLDAVHIIESSARS